MQKFIFTDREFHILFALVNIQRITYEQEQWRMENDIKGRWGNDEISHYDDLTHLINEMGALANKIKAWSNKNTHEAVEVCPHCDSENVYPEWNTDTQGFVAVCDNCGKKLFLCDECMHNEDNPRMNCDWRKEGNCSVCMRGRIEEETK